MKGIAITFGRFNPTTTGHKLLIDKLIKLAQTKGIEHRVYTSQSVDPKKNPLPWKVKNQYMKKMFPKVNISTDETIKTVFMALKQLDNDGYKEVYLMVGSDRVNEFKNQITKYLHHPDPKLAYNFDIFDVVSAGERDPDADDVSGMSASKVRKLATDGNFVEFAKGIPDTLSLLEKLKLMNILRKYMGLKEIKAG
jgi:hypothetical protein